MKKRVLALALVMLLQISAIVPAKAAVPDIDKVLNVFASLGVTNVNPDEDYNTEETVTRASFTDMTAKALGAAPVTTVRYFADVAQDYWAAGSINAMYEMEIISPAGDRRFNPESPITYEQACKIIVHAAGYQDYAAHLNLGMAGYVRMAQDMGFDIKVKDRNALNLGEALQLLYNGMCTNIVVPTGVQESKPDPEKTLFSVYRSVYIGEGIVSAVPGAFLDGSDSVEKGFAKIGNDEFIIEAFSPEHLFGSYVEFVYRENQDGTYTLLYAEQIKKRDEDMLIAGDMLYRFDSASAAIQYYKNAEKKQIDSERLEGGLQIVYNGRPYSGRLADILNPLINEDRHGSIRLVDNNGQAGYDLIIVKSYETFIAGRYDTANQIVYSSNDSLRRLNLNNCEELSIRNEYGSEIAMPEDMPVALSVAESEDGKACEIIVCRNEKSGILERMDTEEGYAVLSGEKLMISKLIVTELSGIRLGNTVTFTMDSFGYAVEVELGDGEMKTVYGVKVKARDEENGQVFRLTVYETDKQFHVYTFAEKVNLDGKRYEVEEYRTFFEAFPGGTQVDDAGGSVKINFKRQPLRIRVNKDNEITDVDTYTVGTEESEKNTLVRRYDGTEDLKYNSHLKRFALDTLYSSSGTTLFIVPNVDSAGNIVINNIIRSETVDMYGISKTFNHDYDYAIETYNFDENNKYTDIIVLKQEPTMDETTVFMYDSQSMALSSDEEVLNQMIGYANGAKLTYLVDDSAAPKLSGLKRGDIVRVVTNTAKTAVCDIIKLFDAETMTFNNNGENANWYGGAGKPDSAWQWNYRNEKYQLSKGRILEIKNGVIKTTYNSADLAYGKYDEALDAGSVQFVIYDSAESEKYRIRGGSIEDALDYKTVRMDCSTALINLQSGVLKQIFIYK